MTEHESHSTPEGEPSYITYLKRTRDKDMTLLGNAFKCIKAKENRSAAVGLGIMLLFGASTVWGGMYILGDPIPGIFDPFTLYPATLTTIGFLLLISPLMVTVRIWRLLKYGAVIEAKVVSTGEDPRKKFLAPDPEVVLQPVDDQENVRKAFSYCVKLADYLQAEAARTERTPVHILIDKRLESTRLKMPGLPEFVVLDWLPLANSEFQKQMNKGLPRRWGFTSWMTLLTIVMIALTGLCTGYIQMQEIFYGTDAWIRRYAVLGLLVPGVLLSINYVGWATRKNYDGFTKVTGVLLMLSVCIVSWAAVTAGNVYYDIIPPREIELEVESFFELTSHRRGSAPESATKYCYVALRCPKGLEDYQLVLLYDVELDDPRFEPGNTIRMDRYMGSMGIPYYKMIAPFRHYKGMDLTVKNRRFKLVSATGYFVPDALIIQQLSKLNVPVDTLDIPPERGHN